MEKKNPLKEEQDTNIMLVLKYKTQCSRCWRACVCCSRVFSMRLAMWRGMLSEPLDVAEERL